VTIVGDLTQPGTLRRNRYDCIVLTQTLQFIYDMKAALSTLAAALKPGGVLLLTVPGISQISGYDERLTGDFWRFTPSSVQRLLEEHFSRESIEVRGYGNVLTAIAFLHNVAQEELKKSELEASDAQYPMIVAARAVKEG
jgi:SAM-dependent methyltransferase